MAVDREFYQPVFNLRARANVMRGHGVTLPGVVGHDHHMRQVSGQQAGDDIAGQIGAFHLSPHPRQIFAQVRHPAMVDIAVGFLEARYAQNFVWVSAGLRRAAANLF
jgi:hypothetical protein